MPIELVTWRVTARGPIIPFNRAAALPDAPAGRGHRGPCMPGATAPRRRSTTASSLAAGQTIAGPAIIEERETTTAIPPGWSATVDQIGCIIASERLRSG